jgi:hypothetical protein
MRWHDDRVTASDEPVLGLAREIRRHAEHLVEDDLADPEAFARAIAALPVRERERLLMETFGRLSPDTQWAIIEHAFGDDEIRTYLQAERDRRLSSLARDAALSDVVVAARSAGRLRTESAPEGAELTVGLFRESQVRAALARGRHAANCARRIVARHEGGGVFRVLDDVFNPYSGYFVTAEYDHRNWEHERLEPHVLVTFGSALSSASSTVDGGVGSSSTSFAPEIYRGGRFDVQVEGTVRPGTLHVGFLLLGDLDVFGE